MLFKILLLVLIHALVACGGENSTVRNDDLVEVEDLVHANVVARAVADDYLIQEFDNRFHIQDGRALYPLHPDIDIPEIFTKKIGDCAQYNIACLGDLYRFSVDMNPKDRTEFYIALMGPRVATSSMSDLAQMPTVWAFQKLEGYLDQQSADFDYVVTHRDQYFDWAQLQIALFARYVSKNGYSLGVDLISVEQAFDVLFDQGNRMQSDDKCMYLADTQSGVLTGNIGYMIVNHGSGFFVLNDGSASPVYPDAPAISIEPNDVAEEMWYRDVGRNITEICVESRNGSIVILSRSGERFVVVWSQWGMSLHLTQ